MYPFFDEEKEQLYTVLVWMNKHQDSFVDINELCFYTGLSRFKVKKLIHTLNELLAQFGQDVSIISSSNGAIAIKNFSPNFLKAMKRQFAEESKIFQLFLDVLQHQESIEQFAKKHFISRAHAYTIKKQLKIKLQNFGINYKKSFLDGDEAVIRNVIYQVFFNLYEGAGFLYDEGMAKRSEVIYSTLNVFSLRKFSEVEKAKLKLFSITILIRTQNQQFIQWDTSEKRLKRIGEHNPEIKILKKKYCTLLNIPDAAVEAEWHYFLLFLYAEGLTDVLTPFADSEVTKPLDTIQVELNRFPFHDVQRKEQLLARVYQKMIRVHYKMFFFPDHLIHEGNSESYAFLQTAYPEALQFVESLIEKLVEKDLIKPELRGCFIYNYLFIILTEIPREEYEQTITICVDFAQGTVYNYYVRQQISSIFLWNLTVENSYSDRTDIFLSDVYVEGLECRQLIWKKPTTTKDWEEFGKEIHQIKKQRMAKLLEEYEA